MSCYVGCCFKLVPREYLDPTYVDRLDEIGKFMVCFSIDIMEKQPRSFQKQKIHYVMLLDMELLHVKNNKCHLLEVYPLFLFV